jgi:hypothetical protein
MDDPPDAGVVLADQMRQRSDLELPRFGGQGLIGSIRQ